MPFGGTGGGPGSSVGGAAGDNGRGGGGRGGRGKSSTGGGYQGGWSKGDISGQIGRAVSDAFSGQNVSDRGRDSYGGMGREGGGGGGRDGGRGGRGGRGDVSTSDRATQRAERRSSVLGRISGAFAPGMLGDVSVAQESPETMQSRLSEMSGKKDLSAYSDKALGLAREGLEGYRGERAASTAANITGMMGPIGGALSLGITGARKAYTAGQSPAYQAGAALGQNTAANVAGALGGALAGPFSGLVSMAAESIAQRENDRISSSLGKKLGLPGAETYSGYAQADRTGRRAGSEVPGGAPATMADAAAPQYSSGLPDYSQIDYASGLRTFQG